MIKTTKIWLDQQKNFDDWRTIVLFFQPNSFLGVVEAFFTFLDLR